MGSFSSRKLEDHLNELYGMARQLLGLQTQLDFGVISYPRFYEIEMPSDMRLRLDEQLRVREGIRIFHSYGRVDGSQSIVFANSVVSPKHFEDKLRRKFRRTLREALKNPAEIDRCPEYLQALMIASLETPNLFFAEERVLPLFECVDEIARRRLPLHIYLDTCSHPYTWIRNELAYYLTFRLLDRTGFSLRPNPIYEVWKGINMEQVSGFLSLLRKCWSGHLRGVLKERAEVLLRPFRVKVMDLERWGRYELYLSIMEFISQPRRTRDYVP